MRIVQEKIDSVNYIELSLSKREQEALSEYMMIYRECILNGELTILSVKMDLSTESEDDITILEGD